MQISVAFPPGRDLVDYALLAESLGYARVWVYDSPALYEDVWIALGAIAGPAFEAKLETERGSGTVRYLLTRQGLELAGLPGQPSPAPSGRRPLMN
mgnify:CR=1 FL=1